MVDFGLSGVTKNSKIQERALIEYVIDALNKLTNDTAAKRATIFT